MAQIQADDFQILLGVEADLAAEPGQGDEAAVDVRDGGQHGGVVRLEAAAVHHVQAAGVAVVAVEYAHGNPQHHAAGNGGHQGILHHVVIRQKGGKVDEYGAAHGAQDGNDGVKFSHEFQRENQDRNVHEQVRHADGEAGEVVEHHGNAREPAGEELVRHQKGIDADGI